MTILTLVYVQCRGCGLNQPLQNTRPRYINQTGCARWLREHGWSGNYGVGFDCPDCTAKDKAERAARKARLAAL